MMHDALATYFNGEKYAGLMLAGIVMVAIVAAGFLYRADVRLRPFAITLGLVALAEIALGIGLYARTGPQVRRLEEQLRSNEANFYAAEGARMARVQRNFVLVEYVELFVIITTAVAAVALKRRHGVISGVAIGLLINASILLAFDLLAERRGGEYLGALAERVNSR
jgi:hypothetical protein